jgi:hypothetical protein
MKILNHYILKILCKHDVIEERKGGKGDKGDNADKADETYRTVAAHNLNHTQVPTPMVKPVIHVVTLCTGYAYEIYERFAGSLYDTGFTGKVYFIVKPDDLPHIVRLQCVYPNVHVLIDTSEPRMHMLCHRFGVIRNHVAEIAPCDYVFLCDSRDVLFQKNMEDVPLDPTVDLHVFEEDILIRDCFINRQWIQDLGTFLKQDIYTDLSANPVICAGTTLCSRRHLPTYLDAMMLVLEQPSIPSHYNIDQAVHMLLCYTKPWKIQRHSNDDNLVNTLHYGVKALNDKDQIVNQRGDISVIVHQYDRLPADWKKRLSTKYDFSL